MSLDQVNLRELRRTMQVELEREKKQARFGMFFGHFVVSVVFSTVAWAVLLSSNAPLTEDTFGMMMLVTIGSLMGLFFHIMSLSIGSRRWQQKMRERAMARALDIEMQRLGVDDDLPLVTKRKRLLSLTDDGELVEEPLDADDAAERADMQRPSSDAL
jgi:hypothetical protein